MKFGGTSLENDNKIKLVSKKIIQSLNSNKKIIVVVSAMAGKTNLLENLAKKISDCKFNSDYDLVVSSGEQISAGLLSMELKKKKSDPDLFLVGKYQL